MIKNLFREIFKSLIGLKIGASIALFKVHAAILYLNLIKGSRHIAMIVCLLVLCAVILACGFLLIPIALCLFMPWAPETKAIVALSFGAAYIIIPLIILLPLFSEKRWVKVSKADKVLEEALK